MVHPVLLGKVIYRQISSAGATGALFRVLSLNYQLLDIAVQHAWDADLRERPMVRMPAWLAKRVLAVLEEMARRTAMGAAVGFAGDYCAHSHHLLEIEECHLPRFLDSGIEVLACEFEITLLQLDADKFTSVFYGNVSFAPYTREWGKNQVSRFAP